MKPCVVALTGLSGVGKTTFVSALATELDFISLQASALIRKGRDNLSESRVKHDDLRYSNLDENQKLLIAGFKDTSTGDMPLVVLDGHTIIERDNDLVRVDPCVFAAIGIHGLIFLQDDPAAVLARREQDVHRHRPKKDENELARIQIIARSHAEDICRALGVPMYAAVPTDLYAIIRVLRQIRDAEQPNQRRIVPPSRL